MGAIGLAALMTMATVSTAQDAPITDDSTVYQRAARPPAVMIDVKGKVVDAKGKVVKGALVGQAFMVTDGTFGASGSSGTTAGDDGTFTIKINESALKGGDTLIQAYAADGSMAGYVIVKKTDDTSKIAETSIKLAKTVKVTGTVEAPEGTEGLAKILVIATLKTKDGNFQMQASKSEGVTAQLHLPKGDYELRVLSQAATESVKKLKHTYMDIKVDDKKSEQDLGKLKLELSPLHGGVGKPAPALSFTHSRGTTAKSLADFKGKWVLIDFWGIWCPPCVASIPKLIEIYEANADLKDSFEFISIHNQHAYAPDLETMDKNIAERKLVEEKWGGKNISWPMMIDGEGKSVRDWGISGFPTMAIVDPEGNFHSWGHHHYPEFAKILAEVRAKKNGGGAADEKKADAEKKPAETDKKADSDKKPNAKTAK